LKQFGRWRPGTRVCRAVTGTAGIGKTMFALFLSREIVDRAGVVLLYFEDRFWAFTKKLRKNTKEYLDKETTVNGTKIYYTAGDELTNKVQLVQLMKRKKIITLRDSGKHKTQWLLAVRGRVIYFASSGQEEFLNLIYNKVSLSVNQLASYASLWNADECTWAAKLGLLPGLGDEATDFEYMLEGYRRFGGSVRNALSFARALKADKVLINHVMDQELEPHTRTQIKCIVDLQNSNRGDMAKAVVFHRSPTDHLGRYRVHFASTYLAEYVTKLSKSDKVQTLKTLAAALSVTTGMQSAYGALYEEEFHRFMFELEPTADVRRTLHFLGHHEPSAKKMANMNMKPKQNPILDFARSSVLHFAGKSLANATLKQGDNPLEAYFHPLTSTFPTHDSFIACHANCFFHADPILPNDVQQGIEQELSSSIVLVGLQQTVSGSDDVDDKPSHTVVGQHLVDHLEGFKKIVAQLFPDMKVLEEVVTVFVSPSESCRKMKFMPVLTKGHKRLTKAIANFQGSAVQYYTVFEVEGVAELMNP